ncbi:hypothetical protein A1D23_03005 [Chelonobacter oris]|uniref:hypothetical protein n=1 Tax=Chelonobacter oris TaxID=505317 RepID=UPI00244940C1|nr:hypothetical protein [Chelonobacter oris]MDH3001577.1 hypothetical protein [Chelonobacter oris]
MFKFIKSKLTAVVATSLLLSSGVVNAAGPDFSSITSGIDFSTAVTAIISVAVAIAGVYIASSGSKAVLRMIRGA